jgi:hypothetical protein
VQNRIQQRIVDLDVPVVADEAELVEFVHEIANAACTSDFEAVGHGLLPALFSTSPLSRRRPGATSDWPVPDSRRIPDPHR